METVRILHADAHVVVAIKPGGLLAVPGRGPEKQDCLMNRVRALFPGCIEYPAAHRLDMDTSGLMVFGLTGQAYTSLCRQFAERMVEKRYVAELEGDVVGGQGEISLPFRLDVDNRPRQIYDPEHGKMGLTRWSVLGRERLELSEQSEQWGGSARTQTRVEFCPVTGRTHQLRVHAAHPLGLGCPIVGDRLYGSGVPGDTLLLHAAYLRFAHPATGEALAFSSLPPF